MPSRLVGRTGVSEAATNCRPYRRSSRQSPTATTASSASARGNDPTIVTSSDVPSRRASRTVNPVSRL